MTTAYLLQTGADLNGYTLQKAKYEDSVNFSFAGQIGYDYTNEVPAWRTSANATKTILGVALNLFTIPTANLDINNKRITNVANGINPNDVANMSQLASVAAGLNTKPAVDASTATTLTLTTDYTRTGTGATHTLTATANGVLSLDGYSTWFDIDNDGKSADPFGSNGASRVLIQDASDAKDNGIYAVKNKGSVSTPWILIRSGDQDGTPANEVAQGVYVMVLNGTSRGGKAYVIATTGAITLDTTNITWTQWNAPGSYSAGTGITQSGTVFSLVQTGTTLTLGASTVDVRLASNGGLEDVSGVKVKADITSTGANASVVKLGANGVSIGVDDSTIEGSAAGGNLRVKDLGISTAKLAATSVTAAKLGSDVAGNGLQGGNGSAISAKADTTGGANLAKVVNVSANGLAVKADGTTVIENGSNQLAVGKTTIPRAVEFTTVGGATTETIPHNFNNISVSYSAYKKSTKQQAGVAEVASVRTVNSITLDFGVDPTTDFVITVFGLDKN